MRLAVVTSHPIQYQAPLFRRLAQVVDLHVYFAHRATPKNQADAGFGVAFEWDVDLTSGYDHTFMSNRSANPGTGWFDGCDTPEIARHLRRGRYDAVLVFGWFLKSYHQAIRAGLAGGTPVMVRGDSQLAMGRSWRVRLAKALVFPIVLRVFAAALYVGERSRAYYRHYRYPASRLFFSPHCIDTEWFAERAAADAGAWRRGVGAVAGEKLLLFCGKLLPFKRPLDLVDAAALLAAEGVPVRVVVAGSGPLEGEMRARAAAKGVPIEFLGFQNQSALPAIYAGCDLLALPSNGDETWGLVANEALACGTPVVISDAAGSAPDLAADGVAGRSFPMGDIAAFARAMGEIIAGPPPAEAIAAKSKAYSIEAAVQGVAAALEAVGRRR